MIYKDTTLIFLSWIALVMPFPKIPPQENFNPSYNPFEEKNSGNKSGSTGFHTPKDNYLPDWEKLYEGFEKEEKAEIIQTEIFKSKISGQEENLSLLSAKFLQLKNDYILTSVRSGLMLIHVRRAYERVLFDIYVNDLSEHQLNVQQLLYPEELELSDNEVNLLKANKELIEEVGIEAEFLQNKLIVNALPEGIETAQLRKLIDELFIAFENEQDKTGDIVLNHLSNALAKAGSQNLKKNMSEEEMQDLSAKLFASPLPNYTHEGKKIIHIISMEEINNFFN